MRPRPGRGGCVRLRGVSRRPAPREPKEADNKPYARMIYLPRNAQIVAGERILTSGLGGVFPAGLYVGSVTQVLPLEASRAFGLYREATIDPGVDLTQLSEMFVVLPGR